MPVPFKNPFIFVYVPFFRRDGVEIHTLAGTESERAIFLTNLLKHSILSIVSIVAMRLFVAASKAVSCDVFYC
jgi:hypothetical protein